MIRDWMTDSSAGPEEPLSPREQEVLKLISEAHTNKEIAATLHLAEKTVESHRANILRKLGMRDRVELVRYAIRRGLHRGLASRGVNQRVRLVLIAVARDRPSPAFAGAWLGAGERDLEPVARRLAGRPPPAGRGGPGLLPAQPGRRARHPRPPARR